MSFQVIRDRMAKWSGEDRLIVELCQPSEFYHQTNTTVLIWNCKLLLPNSSQQKMKEIAVKIQQKGKNKGYNINIICTSDKYAIVSLATDSTQNGGIEYYRYRKHEKSLEFSVNFGISVNFYRINNDFLNKQ